MNNDYHQIRLSGPEMKLARECLEVEVRMLERLELDCEQPDDAQQMQRAERVIAVKALIVRLGG
jgi:hypothetical protein